MSIAFAIAPLSLSPPPLIPVSPLKSTGSYGVQWVVRARRLLASYRLITAAVPAGAAPGHVWRCAPDHDRGPARTTVTARHNTARHGTVRERDGMGRGWDETERDRDGTGTGPGRDRDGTGRDGMTRSETGSWNKGAGGSRSYNFSKI